MLQTFEECENCGVDASNVEWKAIQWEFTEDVSETEMKPRAGKAFTCTKCGHIHSISNDRQL